MSENMTDIEHHREYRALVVRAEKIGMLLITKERLTEISTCACSWKKGTPVELCAAHADAFRELTAEVRLKLAEVERAKRYCVECGCTVLFPPPKVTPDAEGG